MKPIVILRHCIAFHASLTAARVRTGFEGDVRLLFTYSVGVDKSEQVRIVQALGIGLEAYVMTCLDLRWCPRQAIPFSQLSAIVKEYRKLGHRMVSPR